MAELTAEEACNTLHVASGSNVWHLLPLSSKSDVTRWFDWLRDRIATETAAAKDAEIARLKAELDDEAACVREVIRDDLREALKRDDVELDWLIDHVRSLRESLDTWGKKTQWVQDRRDWGFPAFGMHRADVMRRRIEELELAATQVKPVAKPKPRRTGGQKVRDWLENHAGHLDHRINDEAFEAFAKDHGIDDDPEPPTDGELLEKAYDEAATNAEWAAVAAEFLRLRAERDGGEV